MEVVEGAGAKNGGVVIDTWHMSKLDIAPDGRVFYIERTGEVKYIYTASGHEMVQAIIALMWTWLGPVKRAQAKAVLVTYRNRDRGTRAKP